MSEQKQYMSETAKVRDLPQVMKYVSGRVADVGSGNDRITPDCVAFDGRPFNTVNAVRDGLMLNKNDGTFDTIFSSHFLEHVSNPFDYINNWHAHLNPGGYLVLYLPEKVYYNSKENPEHMFDWTFEDFMFWFRRAFCGDGKNYKGEHLPKMFEVVESGLDIGHDKYSFYLVARKV